MNHVKLNLGCGNRISPGWINMDYAFGARLARMPLFRAINRKLKLVRLQWDASITIQDLRKPFPWKDNSVYFIVVQ